MSNSLEDKVVIQQRAASLVPPGHDIKLSERQALEVAELVNMPGWKTIKNVIIHQRKDQIARMALNQCQTSDELKYYKGMAAELVLFPKLLERVKDAVQKGDEAEK